MSVPSTCDLCDAHERNPALRSQKRGEGRRDVTVRLQGVTVQPGDWIVADADGVIVLDKAPS